MDVNLSSVISVSTDYSKQAIKEEKDTKKEESTAKANSEAVVYEKTESTADAGTYKINKMSAEDRKAIVEQLKADQEKRQQSLVDIARDMISKQSTSFGIATGDENIWKFLASGKYEVDAETKAKAQEDISEDGYWGVKQTSKRLFDFASALAGDDESTMKKMQEAIEKGYNKAQKTWGGELPEISKKTLEATNKLFEDYYNSKKSTDTEVTE